jgi:RNA polymerase sigma factor (sigma-70 family)
LFTPSANPSLSFPVTGNALENCGCNPIANRVAELTRRLAAGDEEAFREFHAAYFDRVYRFLLVVTSGRAPEAQEAVQQTFIRVIRYIRVFESEDVLWSWLKVVARSVARDGNRKQQRYSALLERFAQALTFFKPAQESLEESLLASLLEEVLSDVPDRDRDLLEAKYVIGYTVKELSAKLGLTEKAVESRLDRVRCRVRTLLLKRLAAE